MYQRHSRRSLLDTVWFHNYQRSDYHYMQQIDYLTKCNWTFTYDWYILIDAFLSIIIQFLRKNVKYSLYRIAFQRTVYIISDISNLKDNSTVKILQMCDATKKAMNRLRFSWKCDHPWNFNRKPTSKTKRQRQVANWWSGLVDTILIKIGRSCKIEACP